MTPHLLAVLLGSLVALAPATARSVEITNVRHRADDLRPGTEEPARVHFELSEPARVTLRIHDGRDLVVRTLSSADALPAGDHALAWDGRDGRGRPVPPEAYTYTLEARPEAGEPVTWDPTDLTGGETLRLDPPTWDAAAGQLRYRLPAPARVRVRVGLENDGPLLATPVNWVPRRAGAQAEDWDGRDMAGVLDLSEHPRASLQITAFELPQNTLIVGRPERVRLIDDLPPGTGRRESRHEGRPRLFDWARQPIESRRDFAVRLELPEGTPRDADGLPVVDGPVAVSIDLAPEDAALLQEERFEAVFYLDGRFLWENETGFLPVTWHWDPRGVNPGVHYLSTNLRGYAGHFGVHTLKLRVAAPDAGPDEKEQR